MSEPKTFPEMLDAALDGTEFAAVLMDVFAAAARARDDAEAGDE